MSLPIGKNAMKKRIAAVCATLAGLSFAARVVELPQLPEGGLPNSEVVTNIALGANLERLDWLSFSLALDACASNSLSLAVGTAAGDALTLEEADFEWGYDCGSWFYADTATGDVASWPAAETGRVERTLTIHHRDINPRWNRLRIVKRGLGDIQMEAVQSSAMKKFILKLR